MKQIHKIGMSALCITVLTGCIILFSLPANAALLTTPFDSSWTQFQVSDNDTHPEDYVDATKVSPGWGGQDFDAEYLLYKKSGNTLSLGLQAGFDLVSGKVTHNSKDYYAGDLALSFDGDSSNYEYGVDFGLLTMDYGNSSGNGAEIVDIKNTAGTVLDGSANGKDTAGLYQVTSWNTNVYSGFSASSPFAMDGGSLVTSFTNTTNTSGSGTAGSQISYYRIVSFDISSIANWTGDGLDAHWTMSCGNDEINGHAPVPEPSTMLLFGTGLFGLGCLIRKRQWK